MTAYNIICWRRKLKSEAYIDASLKGKDRMYDANVATTGGIYLVRSNWVLLYDYLLVEVHML